MARESARLPPMWPGFDCSAVPYEGSLVFLSPQKTQHSKFQFQASIEDPKPAESAVASSLVL